jgi:hypothetical protein
VVDSITSANIYGAYKDSNDIIYRNWNKYINIPHSCLIKWLNLF